MMERARTLVLIAVFLGALLACKKKTASDPAPSVSTESPDAKRFKELVPKVKTLVGKLPAMAEKAKAEPPVKSDRPLTSKLEKSKLAVVGDKWLGDTHRSASDGELDLDDATLSLCAYAIDKKVESTKDSEVKDDVKYLEQCLAWEYVAVVRARKVTLPKIKLASKSFDPGEVEGDLLLFGVSDATIQARYRFRTTNSDELKWFEGKPEKDWAEESMRDLARNLKGVIQERLALERDSMGH
jgi:hypothetical protein